MKLLIALAVIVLVLCGCGPNKQKLACEEHGGDWEAHTNVQYGYNLSTGKYETMLVTSYACEF